MKFVKYMYECGVLYFKLRALERQTKDLTRRVKEHQLEQLGKKSNVAQLTSNRLAPTKGQANERKEKFEKLFDFIDDNDASMFLVADNIAVRIKE